MYSAKQALPKAHNPVAHALRVWHNIAKYGMGNKLQGLKGQEPDSQHYLWKKRMLDAEETYKKQWDTRVRLVMENTTTHQSDATIKNCIQVS